MTSKIIIIIDVSVLRSESVRIKRGSAERMKRGNIFFLKVVDERKKGIKETKNVNI